MPSKYANTPLSGEYSALERRRAINKALMEQSLSPYKQQMVSGYAVPAWSEALGKVAQGYAAGQFGKKNDAAEERLSEQYNTESSKRMQDVISTLQGRGNTSAVGPVRPIAANPTKAALDAAADPYLSGNKPIQDVIGSMIKANAVKSGGYPSYQFLPTAEGYKIGNRRTGQIMTPEEIAVRSQDDPELQRLLAQQKQLGLGGAEAITDPLTEGLTTQAEQDVLATTVPARKGDIAQEEANVDLAMKPKIAEATALAEREAEKKIKRPKIEASLSAVGAKTEMLNSSIDKAKDQTEAWTTGFLGAATSWVPGTPAFNLGNTLNTIKANIGFDKLREMRDNSPTGGALGQVSELENKLLQQVWSSLEQSQSQGQLDENLEKVRKQVKESWSRVREAYKKDYGTEYVGSSVGEVSTDISGIKSKYKLK